MVHIFDIDYTILKKASAWYFLREALHENVIRVSQLRRLPIEWLRYKLGRPNQDFIEDAVKHIAGIDKYVLEQIAEICFERRIKPNMYTEAVQLIKDAQERGERVIFATSSLYLMIQPLERFLGIEGSVATSLEFDNGKTTGRIAGNSAFGVRKKTAVEAWFHEQKLHPSEVCFYSDSYTDLPLLEICGKPVVVNPDRILVREAKKRGWEVLRFTKTLGN
ncbi:MAG: HAD-IB family hydrolase [Treponema sp.]|nr:HAD-IB family hydrolase [Treponema sp.]